MDRVSAMLMLLVVLFSTVLMVLALFAMAPVFCSCLLSLFYTLYIFIANEESGIHHAQEFENRFWTIFAVLLSTALFFANDSPIGFGQWSPSLGFLGILFSAYLMHLWDRYAHRLELSRQVTLRRNTTNTSSLNRLQALGIPVEAQLDRINSCLADIDQLLIPSTINNFINLRFVMRKEREIIGVFEECDARALNYLVGHVKLGLVFYKIKDHKHFTGQHRTELIQLLAIERLPALTVLSRVIVLHALQGLKLRANPSAENCVKNILMNTKQDDLSDLKTQADAKGVYLDMNKLIFDDIRSETIRQDILGHIQKEAARQRAHVEMGTNKGLLEKRKQWRKVLSDVDDTLTCSAGDYPAGVDKRFGKKVVYPGVLAFYRELDLGTQGPEEWPENRIGNLVFLSARPHLYKDVSEKKSFGKFEKLKTIGGGRRGMHTVPSLLAGDIASGREFILKDNLEPLAEKKFDNFRRYVSIYPEFSHVFVCDNGQGDVRAGELMFDSFPYNFEALYVHVVKEIPETHGYSPERWRDKGLKPCFFRTYPEAALDAAKRDPPLIRVVGLQRVCKDAVDDFDHLNPKKWPSVRHKHNRLSELNQSIWEANRFLESQNMEPVELIKADQLWSIGQQVRTPYGIGVILSFEPEFDMYEVELDWRPLDIQVAEIPQEENKDKNSSRPRAVNRSESAPPSLATVVENVELEEDVTSSSNRSAEPDLFQETNESHVIEEKKLSQIEEASDFFDELDMLAEPLKDDLKMLNDSEDSANKVCEDEETETIAFEQDSDKRISDIEIRSKPLKSRLPKPTARIQGKCISIYTPPKLPKIADQDRGSLFSFWNYKTTETKNSSFKVGDNCTTPYGEGSVVEYRRNTGMVVVDMSAWGARAYLQESCVKVVTKGTFSRLFGKTPKKETLEFPYAEGTTIKTPFGEGVVVRPIAPPSKNEIPRPKYQKSSSIETVGISLTSWVLADNKHPIVYCTVDTAQAWKDMKSEDGTSLFSALGSLVSGLRRLRPEGEKKPIDVAPAPRFQQYYKDGAAVATSFGDGCVRKFRESDGLYEIDLVNWKLSNNTYAKAILQKDQISYRIAKSCTEGLPVLTTFGSGTLASVEPTTGVHIVTIVSAGMVCYLQPENIIRPLKAAVGEDVLTAYGEGKVVKYRVEDDNYEIKLTWGAILFGKAETFDRVSDGMQDHGWFGSSWLLSLFYGSDKKNDSSQRSRSNSIASLSVRSQSAIDI